MDDNLVPTRRDALGLLLGAACGVTVGCGRRGAELPPQGELVGPHQSWGHRLRDGQIPRPADDQWQDAGVVIVGAGIAGLAAARQLALAGIDDFVVLELEPRAGGTAASGRSSVTPYPWGAHYLPVPQASNQPLVELLRAMNVVVGIDAEGEPEVAEEYLCRVPQERLFIDGAWRSELDPLAGASADELAQADAFAAEVDRWVAWRDGTGRRAFSIPTASGSDDAEVLQLDQLTMAQWLDQRGWTSPRLRWLIDYGCRDDYGLTVDQTSAWAGLFYSASRKRSPGPSSQGLITWPEGNGRVVDFLLKSVQDRLHLDTLVWSVSPWDGDDDSRPMCQVVAQETRGERVVGWRAPHVIFAAPQFVAARVVQGYEAARKADIAEFQYGSWLVANLHLSQRPLEHQVPLAWDNVLYDSPSLGYVVATHQAGSDYGPTVWTYYLPLCGDDPRQERRRLDELTWMDAAEAVLSDLGQAHPDLRPKVQRLDVMRWGHAMIRPTRGFVSGAARRRAAAPWRGVHFANTDLSGVALLEEAYDHGFRAAKAVLTERRSAKFAERAGS